MTKFAVLLRDEWHLNKIDRSLMIVCFGKRKYIFWLTRWYDKTSWNRSNKFLILWQETWHMIYHLRNLMKPNILLHGSGYSYSSWQERETHPYLQSFKHGEDSKLLCSQWDYDVYIYALNAKLTPLWNLLVQWTFSPWSQWPLSYRAMFKVQSYVQVSTSNQHWRLHRRQSYQIRPEWKQIRYQIWAGLTNSILSIFSNDSFKLFSF